MAKIGWVYQDPTNRATWIAEYFASQNLDIQQCPSSELTAEHVLTFDLIVIEAMNDCTDEQTKSFITLVRSIALLPIQVLTVHHTAPQAAELLHLGADDVQSIMTDTRILLAHSRALIRRWLSRS